MSDARGINDSSQAVDGHIPENKIKYARDLTLQSEKEGFAKIGDIGGMTIKHVYWLLLSWVIVWVFIKLNLVKVPMPTMKIIGVQAAAYLVLSYISVNSSYIRF